MISSAGWLVLVLSLLSKATLITPSFGVIRKPLLVVAVSHAWTAAVAFT
jgi:hypothetical protein